MTKSEIVTEILDRLELTGTGALARVGRAVNRHYRKVTADLGLQVTRRGTVTAPTVLATNVITFTGIEKIELLIDDSAGEYRILKETTYDELRRVVAPAEADPGAWAVMNQGATSVTTRLDVTCTDVRTLTADGLVVVTDLGDNDEPAFSESFHDYLIERVLQDEYLKQEKPELAVLARDEAARILSALRFHIAKSSHLKLRQRGSNQLNDSTSLPRGGGGGRGDVLGPGSATDNAVVRFDSTTGKLIQNSVVTIDDTGILVTPAQIQSTLATGTAPLQVASTTVVANLNADLLDGLEATAFLQPDGSVPLTANWDAGAFEIRAETFQSDVATGTAPFVVASTTLVSNLNAALLDGVAASAFVKADGTVGLSAAWDAGSWQIRAETFQSDVATGTAPLTVASTTVVTNLNADQLDGLDALAFLHADGSVALAGAWDMGSQALTNVNIDGGTINGITDLAVADGGTGLSSATAYAVLCGGTTSTAALQSVASVGASGEVLTSNGAGALPTFQAATGVGVVAQSSDEVAADATTSETTLFTQTVPANTLGTDNMLVFRGTGRVSTDAGGTRNVNFQFKLGGTVFVGNSNISFNANTTHVLVFEIVISRRDQAPGTIQAVASITKGNAGGATTWLADSATEVRPASNLSFALDTTASQVFALTATNDNNAAGFTTSLFTGQLTVI